MIVVMIMIDVRHPSSERAVTRRNRMPGCPPLDATTRRRQNCVAPIAPDEIAAHRTANPLDGACDAALALRTDGGAPLIVGGAPALAARWRAIGDAARAAFDEVEGSRGNRFGEVDVVGPSKFRSVKMLRLPRTFRSRMWIASLNDEKTSSFF